MSRKMIDPQLLANISRRSVLGTSLGLGALAATELLGGFRSSAATSGPPLGQPGPDMGKLATGQFPARLSPAFEVLLPDAATAWVAWPGCLNGQATAQDSFVWNLNGSEVAWGQIPSSQQAQATATLMPLQALYQHVKFYSDFILGPGVFVMPNITSSSGSAAA